jgi:hypothetical protein
MIIVVNSEIGVDQVQEETIQATKQIGHDSIELQREAASLIPKFQERFMSYYVSWAYPKIVASRTLRRQCYFSYYFSEQLGRIWRIFND